ncbi:aminopeptidase [Henriciella aquimarina]|uniref:aminopeptidase n=1 Tax=Henriciella aquimarina TaxID=545261 RepID=UPI000A020ECC|nr:aminopeptidase [Henriciella aquimarina]
MKTFINKTAAAVIAAACAASASSAQSTQANTGNSATTNTGDAIATSSDEEAVDYDAIAERVVMDAAGVQPGDVVLITGSPSELAMLEALVAQAEIAGGDVITTVNLPNAYHKAIMEAPAENLSTPPTGYLALHEAVDVFINATAIDDPGLFSDVPEERINLVREADKPLAEQFATLRARSVDVGQAGGIPTKAYAESVGADYGAMRSMFFGALQVSPETISARGSAIQDTMESGTAVTVTSPAGTDLSFTLADKPSRVSSGRAADNDVGEGIASAYLPAGDFYACIAPESVSGTLVAPSASFRGTKLKDISMTFAEGEMTAMSAAQGQATLENYFDSLDAPSKKLSVINIGLNPESHMLDGSSYRSWEMAGMTTLVLGNAVWAGCDNLAEGGFSLHLDGTTVTAEDTTVVEAGALATATD